MNFKIKKDSLLPYNYFAEKMVLAAILNNPKAIYLIAQKLPLEAFYLYEHQEIYKVCINLYSKNNLLDPTTITSSLYDQGILEEIDGINLIGELMQEIVSTKNLEEYVSLVQEKYLRRLIIQLGENILEAGFLPNVSLEKIIKDIEEKVGIINSTNKNDTLVPMAELLKETILELKEKSTNSTLTGLASSFIELDNILQGFQNADLIIIAGRPSIGKTSFSLNIATNIAKSNSLPIMIFSLEMSKQQLIYRFLSTESGVESNLLRTGRLSPQDWKRINEAIVNLAELKIFFDDTPNITINNMRYKIKKLFLQQKNIGLIIIDYLQLIQESKKNQNRTQELSQITRGLKAIAREFNVPIIVLSQLSRNVEARTNKRPILSDLRESGCIDFSSFLRMNPIKSFSKNSWTQTSLKSSPKLIGWDSQGFCQVFGRELRYTGLKPVYRLSTTNGLNIDVTAQHKIFSNNCWLKLSALKINYRIGIKMEEFDLNHRQNNFICWEKIVSIKFLGIKKVFDLTVSKTSNFLLNNILIHNSIEQDADVVIMIYREDSSKQSSFNNPSQQNLIEFIVAKHRNGPTGNFRLIYDSKTTRFLNP